MTLTDCRLCAAASTGNLRPATATLVPSFRPASKDDVARAVRELGVRNFVDGSIRVDGNRVRVSAELVDAANQQTVWSNQYDRNLADVLTVQSDIAQQIAQSLHSSLSPLELSQLKKRPTENVEAYKLGLQARRLDSLNRAQNLEAIGLLR